MTADSTALLAEADAIRDAGDWPAAAPLYSAYLALRPDHWQIHVQLGHAVKESGDAASALLHYRRAAELAPHDPDPPLQEGHALRRLGRGADAAGAFNRALALDPASPLLKREVALSRHRLAPAPDTVADSTPPVPEGPPTQLAFDVTDLLDYLREARTPTGIQRVQMGLVGAILDHPSPPAPIALCAYDPSTWRWWDVDPAAFRRTLAFTRTIGDEAAWRTATAELTAADRRPDAAIRPGAILASLGNAWGVEDYFRGLRLLRRRLPVRYAAFVHDCVPLLMPEHCLELTARLYARWFAALALHADILLANSRSTAADVTRFAAPLGLHATPAVIPLTGEPLTPPATAPAATPAEPFIVFTATIESRKSHLMLFQAWLDLAARLPERDLPRLLCIGRPGWAAEAALNLLDRSPLLRRKIEILAGVSDAELAAFTARCLFTVYNSFHEGWGLPVSESLAAGKLAVVPAHSGLLESGAPGAVFFPPGDRPALVATLHRLITDAPHRAALEARINRAAASRPWRDAAAEVIARLAAPAAQVRRPPFPSGARLPLGLAQPPPTLTGAWAEALRDGLGWWWQESWGCWTRDGVATLALPVPAPAGTPVRVVLELRGPPGGLALRLRARGASPGSWRRLTLSAGDRVHAVLRVPAGPHGLAVDLDSGDGTDLGDRANRRVGVGVAAVRAMREDDLPARLSALESALGQAACRQSLPSIAVSSDGS